MDEQSWTTIIFGTLFVVFASFASFMADSQMAREKDIAE